MRVVFLGTSPFAVPTLQALHDAPGHEIVAVVTQPDRPHGRGGRQAASPVKEAALRLSLPVLQPEKVRRKEFIGTIQELSPDVLVVAAFGQIIPQRLLDLPPYGGVNVHGSLLPRWRGAAPMQYALMAGDAETGVTTMQMDAGLDTGDILLQAGLPLTDEDNLGTLETKLAELGAPLLLETLARLAAGDCPRVPQDESLVTHAPSLPPDIGALDWTRPARDLHNLTRGITPRPGAHTFWQGRRLKVLKTAIDDGAGEPGTVQNVFPGGISVATGKGTLWLIEVQPESKGRMAADAWARGARVAAGQRFDAPHSGESG
ncbi:MAG: methionyl-tRNA formyltransferase [Armatimonadetes bacterium]|nr:methionyl-tRNA formyltransferase [Armatimonadota bacterium]